MRASPGERLLGLGRGQLAALLRAVVLRRLDEALALARVLAGAAVTAAGAAAFALARVDAVALHLVGVGGVRRRHCAERAGGEQAGHRGHQYRVPLGRSHRSSSVVRPVLSPASLYAGPMRGALRRFQLVAAKHKDTKTRRGSVRDAEAHWLTASVPVD